MFTDGILDSPVTSGWFYVDDSGHTGLATPATGLSSTLVSAGEIDLSWTLSGFVNYSAVGIYRSTDGGDWELISWLDASATSYHDTTVSAGHAYEYRIGTLNSAGVKFTSSSSSLTPSADSTLDIVITTPSDAVTVP